VLLLSAYDAASHRYWHETLRDGIPDWDWTILSLPPRHFAWRVRGNPLYWSGERRDVLEAGYDLLLATSMVDLATLRGLVPSLADIPTVLYFHENQFAYPVGNGEHGLLEAQMVSLYAALAADRLLFNSAWNRDSFLGGVDALLAKLPDAVPPGVARQLTGRSEVLPVPLQVAAPDSARSEDRLQVLWNHRWEHDKGPELLLEIARRSVDAGIVFHVVGQQFRQRPPAFDSLRELLESAGCLGEWGFVADRQAYWNLLGSCDVALSTAHHDFQGLAVLEACRLGCTPLVPDRLAYPEWFDADYRYADAGEAAEKLVGLALSRAVGRSLPLADVSALDSQVLLPRYRDLFSSLAA
jgi:glycosyltransferase involved in cell wall biosynthesis